MNRSSKEERICVTSEDGKKEIIAVARAFNLTPWEVREAILLYSAFMDRDYEKIARLHFDK